MSLLFADRVKESSTTTGTGTYSLAGAVTGFQGFVAGVGDGNTCYYAAEDGTNWEVGIGTVAAASPDTLARTTILASSNGGAAVNWGAGTRNLFSTGAAVHLRSANLTPLSTSSDITAKAGEKVLVDASVGNRIITLPNTPPIGTRVEVYFQTGSGANTVTITRQIGQTIDGASADEVMYVATDSCELFAISTTAWLARRLYTRHAGAMTLSGAITTNTAATEKKITFDTSVFSIGGLVDTANTRMTVRRAGRYLAIVNARPNSNVGGAKYFAAEIAVNGVMIVMNRQLSSVAAVAIVATASIILNLAAGDYVEGYFLGQEANVGVVATASQTYFSMSELR